MKVLLVQPRQRTRAGFWGGFGGMAVLEPLGLEMVAGALRDKHDVELVDLLPGVSLEAALERASPNVCGISCSFTVDVPQTLQIARIVKSRFPQAFVFIGGIHASLSPSDFDVPTVDAIVVGEGEGTAAQLIEALEAGEDLLSVPGLVINTCSGPVATPKRQLVADLDCLPYPARSLTQAWRKSYQLTFRGSYNTLETSRGCPHRCTFCSAWRFHQGKMRFKSPERVLAEIQAMEGVDVFITDDNFLASIPRAEKIADLLLEHGIKKRFIYQARTDSISRHPETVAKLKEAGFGVAFVGLEKIDPEGMDSIHKANTVESNEKALAILKKAGVSIFCSFIVDPNYDKPDFQQLRRYVRRHDLRNAWYSVLTPLPGTLLFEEMREAITYHQWELFDLVHTVLPTRLDLEEFYKEFARLYRTTYSPRCVTKHLWGALASWGRAGGGIPRLGPIWRSMRAIHLMSSPQKYLAGHQEPA